MDETFAEIAALAEEGLTAYQIQLGHAYLTGERLGDRDVPQNYAEAMKWLQRAHDKGAFTATFLLGTMYEEGRGVTVDVPKAIALYEDAARRGAYLPCVRLARIYANGKGVPESRNAAAEWYRRVLSFEGKVDDEGEMREARSYVGT